ncbi:MAG: zinc-ribbon domain-containing protein [Clostridia bacterium]|nr:zinc-ribbon domain-containing protein [Clostridia bacterium]
MFCPRCSREIEEGSRFCNHCGYEIVPAANSVKDPHPEKPEDDILTSPVTSQSMLECGYELKWYKALIYVLIWLQILTQASNFMAFQAAATTNQISVNSLNLRPAFIFAAAFTVLYAAYLVIVRQSLAGWKTYGPLLFYISIFVTPVFGLLLRLVAALTNNGFSFFLGGNDIAAFAFPILYFILNLIYFRNRAELFTE